MITIDDFTLLPEGFRVPAEGTVVRCPCCGRNGVLQESGFSGSCCLHAETTSVQGDGMHIEPTDCCALAARPE